MWVEYEQAVQVWVLWWHPLAWQVVICYQIWIPVITCLHIWNGLVPLHFVVNIRTMTNQATSQHLQSSSAYFLKPLHRHDGKSITKEYSWEKLTTHLVQGLGYGTTAIHSKLSCCLLSLFLLLFNFISTFYGKPPTNNVDLQIIQHFLTNRNVVLMQINQQRLNLREIVFEWYFQNSIKFYCKKSIYYA